MAEPARRAAPAAPRRRSGLRRVALAVAVVVLLAVAGMAALSMAGAPRNSIHVTGERGLSELAQELRTQGYGVDRLGSGTHALDAFEAPDRTVLVVAGVERAYTPGEIQALLDFVDRGGKAVVADDFGFGDRVGEPFGVNLDRRVLRDATYFRNVSFPVVNATVGDQVLPLTLNIPTSLGFAPDVVHGVLAESSSDSYLDLNQNGVEEQEDAKGSFPVVAQVPRGSKGGVVVFVSDPGPFANDLFERNAAFHRALFRSLLPDAGTVVFDESRHPLGSTGAVLGAALAGEVQATSEPVLAGLVGVSAAVLAAVLARAFEPPEALSTHRGRLNEAARPVKAAEAERRLADLAVSVARTQHPGGPQVAEGATPQELAQHVRDPVVASLLVGRPVKEDPEELLRRIRALEQPRPPASPEVNRR